MLYFIRKTILIIFTCCLTTKIFAAVNITGLENNQSLYKNINNHIYKKYKKVDSVNLPELKNDTYKILKSRGYYSASVTSSSSAKDFLLAVTLGSLYKISKVRIEGVDQNIKSMLQQGDVLLANRVLDEQERIYTDLKNKTCFYKISVQHQVLLDKENHSAEIIFHVETKRDSVFGDTIFTSAKLNENYLRKFLKYKKSECWQESKLQNTKIALMNTGLFSYVNYQSTPLRKSEKDIAVTFNLTDRPHRNIRFGASYYNDEGVGGSFKWANKNLFGAAEQLEFGLRATELMQNIQLDYKKPFFRRDDQILFLSSQLEHAETDAYQDFGFSHSAIVKKTFSKHLSGSIGPRLKVTEVIDNSDYDDREFFGLLSLPIFLGFDNRDNKLDPTRGRVTNASLTPYVDLFGEAEPFAKLELYASHYENILQQDNLGIILATRANIGSILGSQTNDIPASKRFYAGGGNSIRGVEFQTAGPMLNNHPSGGKSLVEFSAELRTRIYQDYGIVLFVDAGNVFDHYLPQYDEGLYLGAGFGLRYYTPFGPVRADVAFPVNKLVQQSDKFQYYFSIGQAF